MSTRSEMARACWYLAITTTIPIMAFLGYVVGKEWGKEIIGALLGTLAGISLVWFDVLRSERIFQRRKTR